mgnify:CR=1 FL=1
MPGFWQNIRFISLETELPSVVKKLTHPNAHFIENIHPLAKWMFPLAEKCNGKGRLQGCGLFWNLSI